jgi:hypothetical protein
MTLRRRLTFAATILGLLCVAPGVAVAAWHGAGTGAGYARAATAPAGARPMVGVTGRNVAVTWPASSFPDGTLVGGYVVTRYSTSDAPQAVGTSCSGTVAALTCTEAAVPPGTWTYAVTPKQGGWLGAEGPKSASAVVGAATLSLTPTTITALPATLSGSIANFATGQSVSWRLDNPTTGTALSGSVVPASIPVSGGAAASVTITASASPGVHTVYAVGSAGDLASQAVTLSDTTAPAVGSAAIAKTSGGLAGAIHQGGAYYVYANVMDPPPSGGMGSVTANVTAVTAGSTAVPLTAGTYTAGGVSYNYRTSSLTATTPLSAGTEAFSITATDVGGHATTASGFTVTVDNTPPAGSGIQTANVAGGTAGQAETGDTISFTFTDPIDPNSISAAWDGTATAVTVHLVQSGANDQVQIFNAADTAALNLGDVSLGRNYVKASVNFTASSMVRSGSTITVMLGIPDGSVRTVKQKGTMSWIPNASATDAAGNPCSTATVSESGTSDNEF